MHPAEEAAFEVKAEKMLAGQREVPNGRNFLAFVMRDHDNNDYGANYDKSFPKSTSISSNMDKRYCPKCDKLKAWCEC
jgi:hypothetical protein